MTATASTDKDTVPQEMILGHMIDGFDEYGIIGQYM